MTRKPAIPFFVLLTAFVAVPASLLPIAPRLEYDRAAVSVGQTWRLLTAQWTHFSVGHLGWDLAVYLALGIVCERRCRSATAAVVCTATVIIPVLVHLACPAVAHFRGLSGIDCALFGLLAGGLAVGAYQDGRQRLLAIVLIALMAFAMKTTVEVITGNTVFVAGSAFAALPASHLAGFANGFLAAVLSFVRPAASFAPEESGLSPSRAPQGAANFVETCDGRRGRSKIRSLAVRGGLRG